MPPIKIDQDAIRNLADLLTETDLTEIEISEGDQSIRDSRTAPVQSYAAPAPAPLAAASDNGKIVALSHDNHPGAVKSPMVGTVYLQPDPTSPRFVTKGAVVKPGDTLLIIEAMKVMNPIKAEKGGAIVDILVEDSQPVEFGQALVIIE